MRQRIGTEPMYMYIYIWQKKMGTKGIAKWVMDSIPSIAVNKFEPQSYMYVYIYVYIYTVYILEAKKSVIFLVP